MCLCVKLPEVEQMEGRGGGRGGGGDECPHPSIKTPLLVGNGPEGLGWVERMS